MHRQILSSKQRRALQRTLRGTQDIRQYRRVLALLEVDEGRSQSAVARTLGVSRASVNGWLRGYLQTSDPAGLKDRPRPGRPRRRTERLEQALKDCLSRAPETSGYLATEWTVPLLIEHLHRTTDERFSEDTIRRALHDLDYVWKRPRYSLVPDPDREKKTLHPRHVAPGRSRRGGAVRR